MKKPTSIYWMGLVLLAASLLLPSSLQPAQGMFPLALLPTGTPCPSPYIIQAGDTLSAIAVRCKTTVAALLAANPSITNRNLIFTGTRLIIPTGPVPVTGGTGTPSPTGTGTPSATATAAPSGTTVQYKVVAGDTLFALARRFNTTVDAILAANPSLQSRNLIFTGTTILIPQGTTSIPVTGGGKAVSYTVQPGDTLRKLAARFNTTVNAIVAINPQITNPNLIFTGTKILIPTP